MEIINKINNAINGIKGLIAFMTKIPIGYFNCNFEEMANYYIFIIFIGFFIGLVGALIVYPFYFFNIEGYFIGVIVLFTMLYIQGFHHVDGLGDYGDAQMVMGDSKRKLEVMRDKYIGVGAFCYIFFVELTSILLISHFYHLFPFIYFLKLIILIEGGSRFGSFVCACLGSPLENSTAKYFVSKNNLLHLILGIIIMLIVGGVLLNLKVISIVIVITALILNIFISNSAKKSFGGVSGDILGASSEITRVVLLIITIFVVQFIFI